MAMLAPDLVPLEPAPQQENPVSAKNDEPKGARTWIITTAALVTAVATAVVAVINISEAHAKRDKAVVDSQRLKLQIEHDKAEETRKTKAAVEDAQRRDDLHKVNVRVLQNHLDAQKHETATNKAANLAKQRMVDELDAKAKRLEDIVKQLTSRGQNADKKLEALQKMVDQTNDRVDKARKADQGHEENRKEANQVTTRAEKVTLLFEDYLKRSEGGRKDVPVEVHSPISSNMLTTETGQSVPDYIDSGVTAKIVGATEKSLQIVSSTGVAGWMPWGQFDKFFKYSEGGAKE